VEDGEAPREECSKQEVGGGVADHRRFLKAELRFAGWAPGTVVEAGTVGGVVGRRHGRVGGEGNGAGNGGGR
jgi:hypothetical protein